MTSHRLAMEEAGGLLSIRSGGIELARYLPVPDAPARESPRPYLHPIRTLGGTVVSDYRPADHDWHWGLSIAVANIAVEGEPHPVNAWGGVTYTADRGYVQLDNNAEQVHDGFRSMDGGVRERLRWRTATGRDFLHEERMLRARLVHPAGLAPVWRLDISSEWTNVTEGMLRFGSPTTAGRENAGYGGLFLRGAAGFSAGSVISPAEPGADAMGAAGPWLGLASDAATVVIAADPGNPVSPCAWFVRTETPMLCAAPFFHSEWPLAAHDSATWQWSLIIADGRLTVAHVVAALTAP